MSCGRWWTPQGLELAATSTEDLETALADLSTKGKSDLDVWAPYSERDAIRQERYHALGDVKKELARRQHP